MRAMSVIPTKSEELVHGIHDHLPPVKKTSILVDPEVRGGSSGRWIFGIPRRGLLHSLKLHIRPKCTSLDLTPPAQVAEGQTVSEIGITNKWNAHVGSNTSHYASTMEYIELYSKQKFIERIYPECIVYANLHNEAKTSARYCFDARKHHLRVYGTKGVTLGSESPFPHLMNVQPEFYAGGENNENIRPHFIVPVPLSTFTSVKKNLQTYFVEPLTLVVKAQPFAYLPSTGYDMALVCEYHEFHPNVETALRNANYKQSIPATIPSHDWILFDRRLNHDPIKRVYALDSDALISAFVIVSSRPAAYGTYNEQLAYTRGTGTTTATSFLNLLNMYVVVEANGEVLLEGSVQDFHEDYSCILNEDYGKRYPDIVEDASLWYFSINLGLTTDNERFSGGLALSSLNNARISIYPNKLVYTGGAMSSVGTDDVFTDTNFGLKVYAKRHFLLRIDSDTGVITRSIES
jgi:hypothetical protein